MEINEVKLSAVGYFYPEGHLRSKIGERTQKSQVFAQQGILTVVGH